MIKLNDNMKSSLNTNDKTTCILNIPLLELVTFKRNCSASCKSSSVSEESLSSLNERDVA